MNVWNKIDQIIIICYTDNKERAQLIINELMRVGINNYSIYWSFNDAFMQLFKSKIIMAPYIFKHPNMINCTMCHYRILKTAYELGKNNILIFEDDIRFLKNISIIKNMILSMPKKYDLLMLDHFCEKSNILQLNTGWHQTIGCSSAGAYICSRTGMEKIINTIEKTVQNDKKHNFHHIDYYFQKQILGDDLLIYEAIPNLCIQQDPPQKCNAGFTDVWNQRYKRYETSIMKHENYQPW